VIAEDAAVSVSLPTKFVLKEDDPGRDRLHDHYDCELRTYNKLNEERCDHFAELFGEAQLLDAKKALLMQYIDGKRLDNLSIEEVKERQESIRQGIVSCYQRLEERNILSCSC